MTNGVFARLYTPWTIKNVPFYFLR